MAMTRSQAFDVGRMMHKLRQLYEATNDQTEKDKIQAQMDRLSPFLAEAQGFVIRTTDADFASLAAALAPKTKQIDDAIAQIASISAGIATAAQIINALVGVLGAAAKI